MPDKCRNLLNARYREGMTPSETAESLGYRQSGIYKLIERCLTTLSTRLAVQEERED